MYERVVGPIYFRKAGLNQVAKFFFNGGSQYRYIEDILTLNEGLAQGIALGQNDAGSGVKIPPTKLLYGTDDDGPIADMHNWKRAHLLPISLPFGTPELPALSRDKDEVLQAVRDGYAAAFDVLAPIADLPFDPAVVRGKEVAKLLFPNSDDLDVLDKRVKVKSSYIGEGNVRRSFARWIARRRTSKSKVKREMALQRDGASAQRVQPQTSPHRDADRCAQDGSNSPEYIKTEDLLASLPGFRGGRLDHIADNLLIANKNEKKA